MNRRTFAFAAALVALTLLGFPASAKAASFSADLTGVFVDFHAGEGIFALEGGASHMGPVSGGLRDKSTRSGRHHEGVFTLDAGGGDTLSFSYVVDQVEPGVWEGTFTITGGTGRFDGASGGGDMLVEATDEPDVFDVTLDGTID